MTKKNNNTEIGITLTVDELNTVIEGLGHLPFMRVYKIIEKIHLQAQAGRQPGAPGVKKK